MPRSITVTARTDIFWKLVSLALCLIAAAGCAVGPDYKRAGDQGPGHTGTVRRSLPRLRPARPTSIRWSWWNGGTPLTIRPCLPWWKWRFAPTWMCAWPRPASARPGRPDGWRAPPSGPRWMPPSSMNGATLPPQPLTPREAGSPYPGGGRRLFGGGSLRAASRRSGNYFRPVWMPPGNWMFSGARGATSRPPPPTSRPRWRTAATSW